MIIYRNTIRNIALSISFLIFYSGFLMAEEQYQPISPLVSTEWLSAHLSDTDLVLLHIGKKDDYDKGHIPGARPFSLRGIILNQDSQGILHEFPEIDSLEAVFQAVGLNDNSEVIICYDNEMLVPLATRLYVTLDYIGLGDRIAILDGGLPLWREENRPISTDPPNIEPGNLTVQLNEKLPVDVAWVQKNLDNTGVVLIDCRPEEQYTGREEDGHAARQGHIAGAINIPFFEIMRDDPAYRFKRMEELEKMFLDGGVKTGQIVVPYCGTGIWSCPVYFVAKYLGYDVRFFDASFQAWSADENLTVIEPVKLHQVK